ncbi:hypothetical protein GUITHDRAFT_111821 [Guillardia theta CCMP2712]|uniref:Rhodanese domain-containing protein n=1 Tax=Guillardia theta (strain CCMP2712) TaxID=905079 RepID=L1J2A4_GUITC|nr:hypothetical protein GUITHDRAFT_111821 [Guillardia theta CCMP2712]EKX42259.1 hypothetical protein GUITHDRAFT_111821 [Guillardia theta CCMP2712]|eukprot:XP_005829239.1 hypothetical protein GUITHDRAFT_111821 [Guillardia theta CCMP2712]
MAGMSANAIISKSGRVYPPLSRPSTASNANVWRPSTSATGRSSLSEYDWQSTIPRNTRYSDVKAKVQSGKTNKSVEESFGLVSARYKRREPFKRVKASKLVEQITLGSMDDVLILDLRSQEEFDSFRIKGARSFPASMMSRSMYQFTPEIMQFKNKDGKLMVLYDLEERISVAIGNLWYEKGIDNFVILTGGIAAIVESDPSVIEGDVPQELLNKLRKGKTERSDRSRKSPQKPFISKSAAGAASAVFAPALSVPRPVGWSALRQPSTIYQDSFSASYEQPLPHSYSDMR